MNTQREPARLVGALVAFAAAVFVALPLLGVRFDADLPAAVENVIYTGAAVVAILAPIVQAELTRNRVWSPNSVKRVAQETLETQRIPPDVIAP